MVFRESGNLLCMFYIIGLYIRTLFVRYLAWMILLKIIITWLVLIVSLYKNSFFKKNCYLFSQIERSFILLLLASGYYPDKVYHDYDIKPLKASVFILFGLKKKMLNKGEISFELLINIFILKI